ncbi:MAG: fumarylacetoacetate hydrolase family protein [SAR324 cluster bacterium]|nr:fumarylacetoacetate hydrolase family protein [SAR324 cluster bacterium]
MFQLPAPSKVVCVGRNYLDHIKELNNQIPNAPFFFIKPTTAIVDFAAAIKLPQNLGELHYELELAVWVGKDLKDATLAEAENAIAGYGLGLDLTLRDLQKKLKEKGHPWEAAKAFDRSLPLTKMLDLKDPQNCMIELEINGETRQKDSTSLMLTPILELLVAASKSFTLKSGDILLTGTPKGVGPLKSGDKLEAILNGTNHFKTEVA